MPNIIGTTSGETLTGTAGDDYFDGMGGADTFVGLTGDDGFLVDSADDVVVEVAGEGTDRVYVTLSYTLGAAASVEILTIAGTVGSTTAIDLTGNNFDQHLWGNDGANILRGMGGTDWLFGYGGNDRLEGGADTDYLIGGAGADVLLGGTGDDYYILDDALDTITEEDGEGADVVYVAFSYTLAAGEEIEFLSTGGAYVSTSALDFTGNEYGNLLVANNGVNILHGMAGNDAVYGIGGTDTLYGEAGADTLVGGDDNDILYGGTEGDSLMGDGGADELRGGDGNDSLLGGADADQLFGDAGNDGLDGGAGADTMAGGDNDDYYVVDSVSDVITETSTGGSDRLYALLSYTLASGVYVEQMFAGGSDPLAAIDLTGNAFANNLYGNDGVNVLTGGDGNDWLFGNGGADTLVGGNHNDYLIGGAGADSLDGGAGNDGYVVDEGDTIADSAGFDTIYVTSNFTLNAGPAIEQIFVSGDVPTGTTITLTGNAGASTIYGHAGIDIINGGGGADTINGGDGNDQLTGDKVNGEAGNDTLQGSQMKGGIGDDVYFGNGSAVELAGEGYDIFYVSANYTLSATNYIEEVIAAAGTAAIDITGSIRNDILGGNAGNNILDGGSGNDVLHGNGGDDVLVGAKGVDELYGGDGNDQLSVEGELGEGPWPESLLDGGDGNDILSFATGDRCLGGAGNDTFIGGNNGTDSILIGGIGDDVYDLNSAAANQIVEADGEGTDTVITYNTFTLAAGVSIEIIRGGGQGTVLTGNELANTIVGTGEGILDGGDGDDRLVRDDGRGGMMTGGAGEDTFVFAHDPTWNGNPTFDEITDFTVGDDRIELDGFFAVPAGQLAASAFHIGTAAADASDRIIYDSTSGKLYYDADGTGGTAAVHFATLSSGLSLDNTSFFGI